MHLVTRFSSFKRLYADIRFLLLNFPDKALHEPEALEVLLGSALPNDVSFQLKVLISSTHVLYVNFSC